MRRTYISETPAYRWENPETEHVSVFCKGCNMLQNSLCLKYDTELSSKFDPFSVREYLLKCERCIEDEYAALRRL